MKNKYTKMFNLNLPEYPLKIKNINNKKYIFDALRKEYVALTPEEYVRQRFTAFLINTKHFPAGRMTNEYYFNSRKKVKRCDTVVFDEDLLPVVIIEYKSPEIKITQKTFCQIEKYNRDLKAKYIIASNGISHYCCKINYKEKKVDFLNKIPDYDEMKNSIHL